MKNKKFTLTVLSFQRAKKAGKANAAFPNAGHRIAGNLHCPLLCPYGS